VVTCSQKRARVNRRIPFIVARVDLDAVPSGAADEVEGDGDEDEDDGVGDVDADGATEDDDMWEEDDTERGGAEGEAAESIFSKMERVRTELERDLGFDKFLEA
jgi:hypothetical protein